MFKRPYVLAILSFLMIPTVTVLAAVLINFIDPEIAARTSNYERNYRLLSMAKNFSILAVLLGGYGLLVSDLFFSGQGQGTIVRVAATSPAWPIWIGYPEHA